MFMKNVFFFLWIKNYYCKPKDALNFPKPSALHCQVLNPAPLAAILWVWSHVLWQGETWSERKRWEQNFKGRWNLETSEMNSELDFSKHHCTNTSLFWMGLCGWVRKKTVQFSNFHQNFQFHLELSGWHLSCHYQGSVFGVWTHFVLCFFLLLTTEPTLLESWVCLTILLIITNKSFATSFVDFFVANHGYCNLVSLAHGNSQGFWNPPVVVFSVRKTRGLKIVVADDFGIYASAPSWMLDDDEEDDVEKDAHRSSSNI